ncbi:MAG TPA: alginate lyase family protein [Candidatus Acidoferrum sp.]
MSYETVTLGFPPPWHVDFVSGKKWEMAPSGELEIVRHDGSDVKAPWELSRLQHLPVIGKAHVMSGESGYREAAKSLLSDWIDRNPVGMGVNWTIAMEAALRSISIVLLLNLLWPLLPEEKPWLEKVTRSLWHHYLYIEAHLEFSHIVRSNHYLSNIVGLVWLSHSLEAKSMTARRRSYQQLVEREMLDQVYADGGDYEASSGYQVLVAQLFTSVFLLLRADQAEVKESYRHRLKQMYAWMKSLADQQGRLPHIGDCDDGRVEWLLDDLKQMHSVALPERDSLRVSSLIGMGETLPGGAPSEGVTDSTWYELKPPSRAVSTGCAAQPENLAIQVLPDSGIAVSRFGVAEIIFIAIPNGIHGKGSHTHNDKLSFIVRLDGEEMLSDSGTGCYSRDAARRNSFRATAAHNTAIVNQYEQNDIPDSPRGIFSLGNEAQVTPVEQFTDGEVRCLRASHYGYRKIGVVHTRVLKLQPANRILIEDTFSGSAKHDVELHFHFGQNWKVGPIDSQSTELRIGLRGTRNAELRVRGCNSLVAEKRTSRISRLFGNSISAEEVLVRLSGSFPLAIYSELMWEE